MFKAWYKFSKYWIFSKKKKKEKFCIVCDSHVTDGSYNCNGLFNLFNIGRYLHFTKEFSSTVACNNFWEIYTEADFLFQQISIFSNNFVKVFNSLVEVQSHYPIWENMTHNGHPWFWPIYSMVNPIFYVWEAFKGYLGYKKSFQKIVYDLNLKILNQVTELVLDEFNSKIFLSKAFILPFWLHFSLTNFTTKPKIQQFWM